MTAVEDELFLEINHLVNNPLTAIRNALYLAAHRSDDPELLGYLDLANQEITVISEALHHAWQERLAAKAANRFRVYKAVA
jgi:two-component sensor histidine kinase